MSVTVVDLILAVCLLFLLMEGHYIISIVLMIMGASWDIIGMIIGGEEGE